MLKDKNRRELCSKFIMTAVHIGHIFCQCIASWIPVQKTRSLRLKILLPGPFSSPPLASSLSALLRKAAQKWTKIFFLSRGGKLNSMLMLPDASYLLTSPMVICLSQGRKSNGTTPLYWVPWKRSIYLFFNFISPKNPLSAVLLK